MHYSNVRLVGRYERTEWDPSQFGSTSEHNAAANLSTQHISNEAQCNITKNIERYLGSLQGPTFGDLCSRTFLVITLLWALQNAEILQEHS